MVEPGLTSVCSQMPETKHPVCRLCFRKSEALQNPVEVYFHAVPDACLWEFQIATTEVCGADAGGRWDERIFEPDVHAYSLAQAVAEKVHALTGFARVMVCKFHPDWSGEVVAEYREPAKPAWPRDRAIGARTRNCSSNSSASA